MRPVTFWCLALTLCAAALFAGDRRVAIDGADRRPEVVAFDSTAGDAGTPGRTNTLDPRTPRPEPVAYIGPGVAISGTTLVKTQPAFRTWGSRRTPSHPDSAVVQRLAGSPSTAPVNFLQLRI